MHVQGGPVAPRDSSYEWLREEISVLCKAQDQSERRLLWVTAEHSLAVCRDTAGRLEIFIVGGPLDASSGTVADVLEHQTWQAEGGTEVSATRVVLPNGDHFDQFGSLLCVELVAHGLAEDPQGAFLAVEPLIALALTRETVADQTLTGLVGEVALLEALLSASGASAGDVLGSWAGSAPSARDFEIGSVGVEVKTTQGAASNHHVEGVHQVELGRSNDDVAETDLFMLSLGVRWVGEESPGMSLPDLVDSVLTRLSDADDRSAFLARVKQYGGDAALGYDHALDQGKARYSRRFYFRFERLYDMADDRLKLLTSESLEGIANVDPRSVKFRVVLGERIHGEHNPTVGWSAIARRILSAAGLPVL